MSIERKGFAALLKKPLTKEILSQIVEDWLTRFDMVEQLRSDGQGKEVAGFAIRSPQDVVWEKDLQFRVLAGEQFTWVYLTADRRAMESDGLANPGGDVLSLDVFLDVELFERVVDDRDDKTLDEWEAKGWM